MQLLLRVAGSLAVIISIIWWFVEPGFATLYTFITGLVAFLGSFAVPKKEETKGEIFDERNRRIMLNHVENFWVKGILEKSLHGVALLELGIKEDPNAVSYPWGIKRESTNKTLTAGKSMLEIFEEIGAGRSLLILGAPGSGKTTMLLKFTRQLIERARSDNTEPIPVVFNLASWTEKQSLADWLAEQLNVVYSVPRKTATKWVAENKMLLLLDGLDEVEQKNREKCVEAINHFRSVGGLTSLTICSRVEEYQTVNKKLSLEGAIILQPLTTEQVNEYFNRFGKSLASVRQLINKDKTLREIIETPLMLSIMTLAYKDKNPQELLNSKNKEEGRKYLFNTYINRMFERPTRSIDSTFTKEHTLRYLSWLARKMVQHNLITYQIEAMQPSWLGDKKQQLLYQWIIGLIGVLSFGLISLLTGEQFFLGFGLFLGLSLGLRKEIQVIDKLSWSWKGIRNGLIGGLILGLSMALFYGLDFELSSRLIVGVSLGLSIGLTFGLGVENIEVINYPGQRLKRAFHAAFFQLMIIGLIGGLGFGLIRGLIRGFNTGVLGGLSLGLSIGLSTGLIFGLIAESLAGVLDQLGSRALNFLRAKLGIGFSGAGLGALLQHYILRNILIKKGFLPRQIIPFLNYAVDLIFLRRVGGGYIFVHRLLMEHFAEMEVEKP